MVRMIAVFISLALLTACNGASDLGKPAVPLGDFTLLHNIAVAPKAQKGPLRAFFRYSVLVDLCCLLQLPAADYLGVIVNTQPITSA